MSQLPRNGLSLETLNIGGQIPEGQIHPPLTQQLQIDAFQMAWES
jgi:hypothetical protein